MPHTRNALRALAATTLLFATAACGDDAGGDVDMSGDELGPDRFAVLSENEEIKLGLTDDVVYFALSDSSRQEAQQAMAEAEVEGGRLGNLIGGAVRQGVDRALAFKVTYPIDRIRDIRWQDDRLVIELLDGTIGPGDDFQVDDESAANAFRQEDIEAFAAAFRAQKQR